MDDNDRYRVVLAPGSCDQRTQLRDAFECSGYFTVVAEASTGLDALREVQHHKPDAVVLGSLLPKLHGLAALPLVRAASPATVIMLLAVTPGPRISRLASERGAALSSDHRLPPDTLVDQLVDAVMSNRGPVRDAPLSPG